MRSPYRRPKNSPPDSHSSSLIVQVGSTQASTRAITECRLLQIQDRSEDEQLEFETAEVKHDCWIGSLRQ